MRFLELILIAFGGGIGAVARYLIIQFTKKLNASSTFATIFVNLVGSFFIGILSEKLIEQETLHLFLTVGILGGFTTYSTFAFESIKLLQNKIDKKSLGFILVNMIGGLIFFIIGVSI